MTADLGVAAFALRDGECRTVVLEPAPAVRGASVLKPLLAWVAASNDAFQGDRETWARLARPMITTSDNDATAALWSHAGGERLLHELAVRTGVAWPVDDDAAGGEHPSLRLLISAGELATAYGALAADDSDEARQVRRWMRDVVHGQAFGLRDLEPAAGVKCGWFGGRRVHAVALVDRTDRVVGGTVTTTWTPDEATAASVRAAVGDDLALAAVHDAVAGATIRLAMGRALEAAAAL